jgi:glycosyl transferase family 90
MPRLHDVDRLFRKSRLQRALTLHLPLGSTPFRNVSIVRGLDAGEAEHRFMLRKEGHRLLLVFDHWPVLGEDRLYHVFTSRPGILVHAFARTGPEVEQGLAEISDGAQSGSGIISFCSAVPGAILVPDCDFYSSGGYAEVRSMAGASRPVWAERDATIVWRGGTTGKGLIATDDLGLDDLRVIPRTRLCLALRGMPEVDAKLSHVVQSTEPERDRERLLAAGIFGDRLEASTWRGRKFAIDIDGNSNAWSNLFTRLLLGCCVIKVGSQRGYRQWYYEDLRPFEHFVPVAADLSDLIEKIEWCRAHDRECAAIASAGQQLALERTLETELSETVERLNRALQSPGGTARRNAI